MDDFKKTMKLSMIFGISGAMLTAAVYECYANISYTFALFLLVMWSLFVGIKFSSISLKPAFIGITANIAYSGILGFICFIMIHPSIVKWLEKNSKYFYLTLREQTEYVFYVFVIMLFTYVIYIFIFALKKSKKCIIENKEKSGLYIENAFDEGEE